MVLRRRTAGSFLPENITSARNKFNKYLIKKLIEYQKLHRIHTIWSLENFLNVHKFDLLKNITCFIIQIQILPHQILQ